MNEVLEMPKSETQTGAEAMAMVERQVLAHHPLGCTITLLCPFCHKLNLQGQLLCCKDMRNAVIAVLMGQRAMKMAALASEHGQ